MKISSKIRKCKILTTEGWKIKKTFPEEKIVDYLIEGQLQGEEGNSEWEWIGERKSEKAARNLALREVKNDRYQQVAILGTNDIKYGGEMLVQLFVDKEGKIISLGR